MTAVDAGAPQDVADVRLEGRRRDAEVAANVRIMLLVGQHGGNERLLRRQSQPPEHLPADVQILRHAAFPNDRLAARLGTWPHLLPRQPFLPDPPPQPAADEGQHGKGQKEQIDRRAVRQTVRKGPLGHHPQQDAAEQQPRAPAQMVLPPLLPARQQTQQRQAPYRQQHMGDVQALQGQGGRFPMEERPRGVGHDGKGQHRQQQRPVAPREQQGQRRGRHSQQIQRLPLQRALRQRGEGLPQGKISADGEPAEQAACGRRQQDATFRQRAGRAGPVPARRMQPRQQGRACQHAEQRIWGEPLRQFHDQRPQPDAAAYARRAGCRFRPLPLARLREEGQRQAQPGKGAPGPAPGQPGARLPEKRRQRGEQAEGGQRTAPPAPHDAGNDLRPERPQEQQRGSPGQHARQRAALACPEELGAFDIRMQQEPEPDGQSSGADGSRKIWEEML